MTHGFQQQDPAQGFCIPKTATAPQHGQKPNKAVVRTPTPPSPRPGH